MTRPVQHHFVTRAYLEGFVDADGQLHIYERGREKSFALVPEKAARQRNYYAVKSQDGKFDDTVERFLDEQVESPAMKVVRKLADSGEQPSWEERAALARWISFQEMRTPMQRGGFEEIAGKLVKKTMLMMARTPGAIEEGVERLKEQGANYGVTAEELRKGIEEDAFEIQINPVLSMDVMMQAEEFVPFLTEMKWSLFSAGGGVAFVTSDHPVIRHDPDARSPYRFGLISSTIEFGLPLSKSKFLLITHDFEREQEWMRLVEAGDEQGARKLRESIPAMDVKQLDGEKTSKLREGIIRSAPRFIFCPDENQEYADLLKKDPWTLRMQVG